MYHPALMKRPKNNMALSSIFHQMADCYRYLGAGDRFRAIAYENVSKVLHNMKEDIATHATDTKTLDSIGGIGESIAEKIIEYLHTGHIKTFDELKKRVPFDLLELMDVTGFGPATLRALHEKGNIANRQGLVAALNENRLKALKGFGEKRIGILKRALKLEKPLHRFPLRVALKIALPILNDIRKIPGVQKAELAGSLRRKKETIGDIDIIVLADTIYRKRIVNVFTSLPRVAKVLAKGTTKASVIVKEKNIQVDLRLVNSYEYGATLLYLTGSKEHNIKLRTIAKERGYKINEYGIFDAATNKRMAGETEEEMYAFLDLKYIPPEQRVDAGEIEKAMIRR